MRFLGLEINKAGTLNSLRENRGGWMRAVYESFTGAWQQNVDVNVDTVLSHHAIFSCISLISSDVSKMKSVHMKVDRDGIWSPVGNSNYQKLLRKPNRNQNRIQFFESWLQSKLSNGNTYVFKDRGKSGRVEALYVLDPNLVTPLVSDDGQVFYQISKDNMVGMQEEQITVPASEIIHDRWNTLHHPLVGLSPIYANGLAATQGLAIQNNSTKFFQNDSRPSGILTAPKSIGDETAARLKTTWNEAQGGDNYGKLAVLGDGLEYKAVHMSASDSQLIEQLKWSAEVVCGVFGVPTYKVGIGEYPKYDNITSLDNQYYSQCLQILIESIEELLFEHLSLPEKEKIEFNLHDLLRMDVSAQVQSEVEAVKGGIKAINESRKVFNLKPVDGGETPYLQEQNYSLASLARRDAQPDPDDFPSEEEQLEVLRHIKQDLNHVQH